MTFEANSTLIFKGFDPQEASFYMEGILTNKYVKDIQITQKSLVKVQKENDFLCLYASTEAYLDASLQAGKIEGKIIKIEKINKTIIPSDLSINPIKIHFLGKISEDTSETQIHLVNKKIGNLTNHKIKLKATNIFLETIQPDWCIWKVSKTLIVINNDRIEVKNLKIKTNKGSDAFGLDKFIETIKIKQYFEYLNLKEISIFDEATLGITKQDETFSLCRIDKDYIKDYNKYEKTLYTFIGVLSGKMKIKKTDD